MSDAANRRALLESVQALVKARQPDHEQIIAVFVSLSSVLSDLTGEKAIAHFDIVGPADATNNNAENASWNKN